MNDFVFLMVCLFFAATPPLLAVTIRQSVKIARQRLLIDLDKYFRIKDVSGRPGSRNDDLLHSFEFVKFKYGLDGRGYPAVDPCDLSGRASATPTGKQPLATSYTEPDFHACSWTLSGLPLFALLAVGNGIALLIILVGIGMDTSDLDIVPRSLSNFFLDETRDPHSSFRYALLASYIGAYTFMIRSFFQAINNFDLMPGSFFGAFNNVVFGAALPPLVFGYLTTIPDAAPVLVPTFFVLGYMPNAALGFFLRLSWVKTFKGERVVDGEKARSLPIEVLDGIDSLVQFRLSDFHLATVQNLACANPIMLFVETPFGFYQSLDWVAQAQLCVSVGVDRLFDLWDLGIRTILDLERAVLHESECVDADLLWAIESALFREKVARREGLPPARDALAGRPAQWTPQAIQANVRMRIDTPYTHRLRQIVNCISDQLGPDNRTLSRQDAPTDKRPRRRMRRRPRRAGQAHDFEQRYWWHRRRE